MFGFTFEVVLILKLSTRFLLISTPCLVYIPIRVADVEMMSYFHGIRMFVYQRGILSADHNNLTIISLRLSGVR